jgi:hypothetical protein
LSDISAAKILADTSVWSLAVRHDRRIPHPAVDFLDQGLEREAVLTTGLVLQELLQGLHGPRSRKAIIEGFNALPWLIPQREDYIAAAELRNECRRRGVQIDTVDALLAQLCIANDLTMLTTDNDFTYVARHAPLKLWRASN